VQSETEAEFFRLEAQKCTSFGCFAKAKVRRINGTEMKNFKQYKK
jgi:hypothetical protein